ncbi:hypothetical protein HY496_01555 [Candidatus Woesearchaeota archaeon]|nr:hypothetical protein [Candidatus Woesearchaeota archaeon]
MLQNCSYNKVKTLHEVSRILHFIRKHAKVDAAEMPKGKHTYCSKLFEDLERDLEKHAERFRRGIEVQVKKGAFK